MTGTSNPEAVWAQVSNFGFTSGWSIYQPSPPTFLLGVGAAERSYSSQLIRANGYGYVRYGFAIMEVSGSVDNGSINSVPQSLNGNARANAELRFLDRLSVESATLPGGSIVTVKIVMVTSRANRTFYTRYVDGSTANTLSPYGSYTVSYSAATTNGSYMHGRELNHPDGNKYLIIITNAMVGGRITLFGRVSPSASVNVTANQNKNYESAKDQCSVFITARSLDPNVTLTSASGTVYPPEDSLGVEVAPYGTNEFVVAAPPGMLLQTVNGLGDDAGWSNASSNVIARLAFTNNAGFFRAAAP